ncbi:nickel pincer cofactor biosynthesis protein LarB [Halorubellus sp. JP-L1]|uniref:nickel pincer cofactor biosynthesis protein LarB n=1 Tax=Halorubellus sp. JP-L1 TaxID=2715753 RepID=UPI0014077DFC|nr:nickel pincer cofactor biosynthesis protein LarB [Halorubellus sp. JP-L1]NHN41728.1 nickel pincer cofactor biosynthesis protein LarB [Halorubellus sp. JP-L1]
MRDVLERVAAGDLSPAAAEAELRGYATTDDGRFDAAREQRRGVPEAVLADEKTPTEVANLAATAVETTGRALVTRASDAAASAVRERVADAHPDATVEVDDRARFVVVHAADYDPPEVPATVGVVTGGTGDAEAAGEAAVVAREMGATVETIADVGVASIARVLDARDALDAADALVVAAGREGALPTVVAGLVDAPVVGLPVSTGYGHGGEGEAALDGMLQSCTVLSVVNVDAGFVAGAQAALVARAVGAARDGDAPRTDDA